MLRSLWKGQVFSNGQVRKQRIVLEYHADATLLWRNFINGFRGDQICPWVTVSNPANFIRQVVLPEPEGLSMVTNSPCWINRFKFFTLLFFFDGD